MCHPASHLFGLLMRRVAAMEKGIQTSPDVCLAGNQGRGGQRERAASGRRPTVTLSTPCGIRSPIPSKMRP